jgi:putative ABC transport system permease protein
VIQQIWRDTRYTLRSLRRSPWFALLVITTLAVGIGANAAIFSVVDAVLLRPLPFPHPDELVVVGGVDSQTRAWYGSATPANFLDWQRRSHSFTDMASYRDASLTLLSGGYPERHSGAMVNASFFRILQLHAAIGRTFTDADGLPGAPRVVVLGDGIWRERFGTQADILGQTIHLEDEAYTVIGVMPEGVDFPDRAEVWITPHWAVPDDPLLSAGTDPSAERDHDYFSVLARLKSGVTREAASADMTAVAAELEREYPQDNRNTSAGVIPLRDQFVVSDVRSTTLVLFAAVGLLLLIATANVSGLLMARAASRHQEIAVRVALGASRGRVIAQLLTESVILAIAGGGAGVLLAMWLVPGIVSLSPVDLGVGTIGVDTNVLFFGFALSAVCGFVFGLAPARQLTRLDINEDLKQSARGGSGGGQRRLRALIVTAEIALSLVLLVAAGLTVRSFIRLQHAPLGFDSAHLVTFRVGPSATRYRTPQVRAEFWRRTLAALAEVPHVEVAGVSRLPLTGGNSGRSLTIPGLPPDTAASADYRTVTPGYFRLMNIRLRAGRDFTEFDQDGRPRVAIVTVSAAQRYWPGQDPIGRTFGIGSADTMCTIVGVVDDIRAFSLADAPRPMIYVPYEQDAFPFMTFVARGAVDAANVRQAIWTVDKDQPVGSLRTLDEEISTSLARRRFSVTLLTAFGGVALLLAAVGLYGVLAFLVSQRRREIGVRIALGATARDVIRSVLGEGLRLVAIGMLCGVALSLATTRLMASLLFGTSPTDVVSFVGAAAVLATIALGASLIPALRASRVDPLVALRDE